MPFAWRTIGVVHLHDLVHRSRWDKPELSGFLEALGERASEMQCSSAHPPQTLVALCGVSELPLWSKFRHWLSHTLELHIVLVHDGRDTHRDIEGRTALERETLAALPGVPLIGLLHWVKGDLASEVLPPLRALLGSAQGGLPEPDPLLCAPDLWEPGPWVEVPPHSYKDPELVWPRLTCCWNGLPSLYQPASGRFLNLLNGRWSEPVGPPNKTNFAAVWPDGSRLLSSNYQGVFTLTNLEDGTVTHFSGPAGAPFGVWPGVGGLGWVGQRSSFSWVSLSASGGGGTLSAGEHDWPCGHEKKQYGFLDNEPCWVQLSGLGDCYLSVYQKDAVISSALPVRWRALRNGWAAFTEPASDPGRTLFFIRAGDEDSYPGDPLDAEDGDARDLRPAIVLGPDPRHRYAVDLQLPVYRIIGEESQLAHPTLDGFGVFDTSHALIRKGSGRLLGGWGRALTVLEEGRLWREDIITGSRADLGPEDEEIAWAYSLPATGNLILVSADEDQPRFRLV